MGVKQDTEPRRGAAASATSPPETGRWGLSPSPHIPSGIVSPPGKRGGRGVRLVGVPKSRFVWRRDEVGSRPPGRWGPLGAHRGQAAWSAAAVHPGRCSFSAPRRQLFFRPPLIYPPASWHPPASAGGVGSAWWESRKVDLYGGATRWAHDRRGASVPCTRYAETAKYAWSSPKASGAPVWRNPHTPGPAKPSYVVFV